MYPAFVAEAMNEADIKAARLSINVKFVPVTNRYEREIAVEKSRNNKRKPRAGLIDLRQIFVNRGQSPFYAENVSKIT